MTPWVADTTDNLSIAAYRAVGAVGVMRYLSYDGLSKVIGVAEYHNLSSAGIQVGLNWEYDAHDWLGGTAGGKAHATKAVALARERGYPQGSSLPGSADFDMTIGEWNSAGKFYATAYADIINSAGYVAGVYGPWDVLAWCQQLGGFGFFWQSMSKGYSGGRNRNQWPGVHLWQQLPQRTIGGTTVDYNQIIKENWLMPSLDSIAATLEWVNRRVEALGRGLPTMVGDSPQKGEAVWAVKELQTILSQVQANGSGLSEVKAALAGLTVGGLSDTDRAAIQALTDAVNALNSRLASP